jgi:hypothetical protein
MPEHERIVHWLEGMGLGWLVVLPFVWAWYPQSLGAWCVAGVWVPLMALAAVACLYWLRDRIRELRGSAPEAE